MEELQAARELHTAAERKLAEGTAALDGRFEEVETAVQVSKTRYMLHNRGLARGRQSPHAVASASVL